MEPSTHPQSSPSLQQSMAQFTPIPGLRPTLTIERLQGMLIGVALGDSLGLAVETMTNWQISERYGRVATFLDLEANTFLRGKGLLAGSCSDDAQLTGALFRAYIEAGGFSLAAIAAQHVLEFDRCQHGWGGSTLAGVQALKNGLFPGDGEFEMALRAGSGNGIPMKIAAVAAWFALCGGSSAEMVDHVQQICSLSHANSLSASAGLAHVAALLYCLSRTPDTFSTREFVEAVSSASALGRKVYPETLGADDLTQRLSGLELMATNEPQKIIDSYDGGDCYVYNSLPFSYAFFLRGPADSETLLEVINAGGDTDSNAALVGALQGALVGPHLFPVDLVSQVRGLSELLEIAPRFLALAPATKDLKYAFRPLT